MRPALGRLRPRTWLTRLGLSAAALAALVSLAPGVGTQMHTVGWADAWRAKLGWPIPPDELRHNPLADADGDGYVAPDEMEQYRTIAEHIGFRQRMPRTILALLVGVTLAMCGGTFQVLFRNALATPYTLGIASGGSLGAVLAIRLGLDPAIVSFGQDQPLWTMPTTVLFSFAGGLGVVGLVFVLARGSRRLTSNELLLAGVTIGLFCSAMMTTVQMVSNERQTFQMIRWMMGSLDTITNVKSLTLLPLVAPAWIVLTLAGRALNQYRLGDDLAAARGVHVGRLQAGCVLVATLATAAVVAHCGPIGFVGLVVPHMVVLLWGPDCRIMLPAAGLFGGAFLILCDWASQLTMRAAGEITGREIGSAVLPVGVVTAVVGVPVFLVLLRTRRQFL